MRWLVAVALAACGRVGFDPQPPPRAPWDDPFTLTPPELVPGINSSTFETECFVTADGLTLYFASARGDSLGFHDIYSASRAARDAPFGAVVHHAELSTPDFEGRFVIAGDHGYLWSDRPGGVGQSDIWEVAPPFDNAHATDLAAVSTTDFDYDPWPSADDQRLYYGRLNDIAVAERDASGAFGPGTPIAEVSSASIEDNPAVSADERFLIFSSDRPGGLGLKDIYYARRADRDAPFSAPQLLPVVNTVDDEYEACLTEDGELFFSSDRPGGLGSDDIYRAQFVPL